MNDAELVAFLRSALPRLGLRWTGFRNMRGTVGKRLRRRMAEVGAQDLAAYAARLDAHPEEWRALDAICRIPISRMYRDRAVYDVLVREILPERARAARESARPVRVWSAGCASGEEPYTVSIGWQLKVASAFPDVVLEVLATDIDEVMLQRARTGCYKEGSLRELPEPWRAQAFLRSGDLHCVRDDVRANVRFLREDLRITAPEGPFDVVLCRNSAFTYFDERVQASVADRLVTRIVPGGVLVIGAHESLPLEILTLAPRARSIFERRDRAPN